MVDLLIRGVDESTARILKARAATEKRSLNDLLRETLAKAAEPAAASRAAFWAEVDAIRAAAGPMTDTAVDLIREVRDEAEARW
jgi:plasmid stability protein